jgi:hypothetical protein
MRRALLFLLLPLAACGVAPAVGQSKPTTTVAPTTTTAWPPGPPPTVGLTGIASCTADGWQVVWSARAADGATVSNSISELGGLQPLSWTGWSGGSGTAVYSGQIRSVWMMVSMQWPNPDGSYPRGGSSAKVIVDRPNCG